MASYQLMCSVVRPKNPTEACNISNFEEKINQHSSAVIHDVSVTNSTSSHISSQTEAHESKSEELNDDSVLFALVAKTTARFSGGVDRFIILFLVLFCVQKVLVVSLSPPTTLLTHLASH